MKLIDVPERHLPADFADRLIRLIRRRRRVRQMGVAALLVALCLAAVCLFGGFLGRDGASLSAKSRLVAARDMPTDDAKVSNLLLLGLFRECFRRSKVGKGRKEEED